MQLQLNSDNMQKDDDTSFKNDLNEVPTTKSVIHPPPEAVPETATGTVPIPISRKRKNNEDHYLELIPMSDDEIKIVSKEDKGRITSGSNKLTPEQMQWLSMNYRHLLSISRRILQMPINQHHPPRLCLMGDKIFIQSVEEKVRIFLSFFQI